MNENNEFDYTVTKKIKGKYLLHRILMILGYIAFALTFFFGLYALHLYQFIAFIILVEWIVIFFTWRYVSIEYRYETVSGSIRFLCVYGSKTKKTVLEHRIKDFSVLAPCKNMAEVTEGRSLAHINCLLSEDGAPDSYYGIYQNEEGQDCAVFFEVTQKTLKILRFYNAETVHADTRF